jgi:hypothetical protein
VGYTLSPPNDAPIYIFLLGFVSPDGTKNTPQVYLTTGVLGVNVNTYNTVVSQGQAAPSLKDASGTLSARLRPAVICNALTPRSRSPPRSPAVFLPS